LCLRGGMPDVSAIPRFPCDGHCTCFAAMTQNMQGTLLPAFGSPLPEGACQFPCLTDQAACLALVDGLGAVRACIGGLPSPARRGIYRCCRFCPQAGLPPACSRAQASAGNRKPLRGRRHSPEEVANQRIVTGASRHSCSASRTLPKLCPSLANSGINRGPFSG
jgi:hypothetical protein